MKDLAFFSAGCHQPKGVHRHLKVVVRRALRRVLRPIFLHQIDLFLALFDRLYEASPRVKATQEQVNTALAFSWDNVALVRRLAALEDQVAALTGSQATAPTDDNEPCSSIFFPGLDKPGTSPADPEAHAKVCSEVV